MTDLSFASGQRFTRLLLILTLALGAVAPSGATASSIGSCREYLEAKDAKESAFLLWEQRRDEASEGSAKDAAVRWRQARKAVKASLKAGGDKMLGHILTAWEKARNAEERFGGT